MTTLTMNSDTVTNNSNSNSSVAKIAIETLGTLALFAFTLLSTVALVN